MTMLRPDLAIIAGNVAKSSRVLDIGCGDGTLLAALRDQDRCDARGMELDPSNVAECVAKGLSVIQGDADKDLAFYPDDSFDYAILSQTLQTTHRLSLLWGGRMPVTRLLPIAWYATSNIHHMSVTDFRALAAEKGARIEQAWFLGGDHEIGTAAANVRAEHAIFLLSR